VVVFLIHYSTGLGSGLALYFVVEATRNKNKDQRQRKKKKKRGEGRVSRKHDVHSSLDRLNEVCSNCVHLSNDRILTTLGSRCSYARLSSLEGMNRCSNMVPLGFGNKRFCCILFSFLDSLDDREVVSGISSLKIGVPGASSGGGGCCQ
jgi:hypothetical protein